jgi:penicillin V acylase-like amidase (Ntn superfamily)
MKITFTFTESAYNKLEQLQKKTNLSKAEVIQKALQLLDSVESHKEQGFSEVVLRNLCNNRERILKL